MSDASSEPEWECGPLFPHPEQEAMIVGAPAEPTPGAFAGGFHTFHFGVHAVTLFLPSAEEDTSVGLHLWQGSFICARALLEHTVRIEGATVLELGAGVGLCGFLAAELGAKQVILTDCDFGSLKNLLRSGLNRCNCPRGLGPASWGTLSDQLCIKRHLWENDLSRSPGRTPARHWSNVVGNGDWGPEGMPPELQDDDVFEVVIGSDVLYFQPQVAALLATLAARLAPGGLAVLSVTVRTRTVYQSFLDGLAQAGLALVSECKVEVDSLDSHHFETGVSNESSNAKEVRLVQLLQT